jgi:hypothetical protein
LSLRSGYHAQRDLIAGPEGLPGLCLEFLVGGQYDHLRPAGCVI